MVDRDPIVIRVEVAVKEEEDGVATVQLPQELRVTEKLATTLNDALKARDLKLRKWVLSEAQQKELKDLNNVKMEESEA